MREGFKGPSFRRTAHDRPHSEKSNGLKWAAHLDLFPLFVKGRPPQLCHSRSTEPVLVCTHQPLCSAEQAKSKSKSAGDFRQAPTSHVAILIDRQESGLFTADLQLAGSAVNLCEPAAAREGRSRAVWVDSVIKIASTNRNSTGPQVSSFPPIQAIEA